MSVKIPLKLNLLILLASLAGAAGICFLLNIFLAGTALGLHYDFLLTLKKPPPVSSEILIINTNEYIENNDFFSVLMTLTEMESTALVMTGNLSPLSSPVTVTETEIRRRFLDEYLLIGSNIRNLFEAIRMGSVSPVDAPDYVNKLVELTEHGRDRLLSALIDRDEAFLLSIAVFGNYIEVESKQKSDTDGVLRRVQPIDMEDFTEHPVYANLKSRYSFSQIETIDKNKILYLKNDDAELNIMLDNNANIITPWNCTFRNIDISLFKEYEEADRAMQKALEDADVRGIFSKTLPERSPLFLGEYALMLREDMLNSPNEENKQNWMSARLEYIKNLDEFINGGAEMLLVSGYDEVIEDTYLDETSLDDEGIAALAGMRDGLRQFFIYLREVHEEFSSIRYKLEEELSMSFCIMGPQDNTQYSALLANTLITGNHVNPIPVQYVLLASYIAVFIILLAVFLMRPVTQLVSGLGLSVICAVLLCVLFVFKSIWIDPIIAFGSSVVGIFIIFSFKCAYIGSRKRLFRAAYGSSVPQDVLKKITMQGKPHPREIITVKTCVIAIKDVNLLKKEARENQQNAGMLKKMFFSNVKDAVFKAGAVIAGFEGDTILACFGSPLESNAAKELSSKGSSSGNSGNPVSSACAFVQELFNDKENVWCFGIDAGDCTFYWSQETGLAVHGRPSVRARMLASRTVRLKVRALITDYVHETANLQAKKVDTLFNPNDAIYELAGNS